MATVTSTNPFLPSGTALPQLKPPVTNGPAIPTTTPTPVTPTAPLTGTATSGATTTSGAPTLNFSTTPAPASINFPTAPALNGIGNAGSTMPAVPTVALHPPITAPSGTVVSPSTGGVVPAAQNQAQIDAANAQRVAAAQASAQQAQAGYANNAPATPYIPSSGSNGSPTTSTGSGNNSNTDLNFYNGASPSGTATTPGAPATPNTSTDPTQNPLVTSPAYQAAVSAYQAALPLTPEETQNQTDINNLQNSLRTAYTNTDNQSIPLDFITGQQKQLQSSEANLEAPLQAQAALLQAKRTANLDASKFAVQTASDQLSALRDISKPVSLSYGGELVNPVSGATINGGAFGSTSGTTGTGIDPSTGLSPTASTSDILGYLSTNGIDITRYSGPGLINAVQNGATAQDILSGRGAAAGLIAGDTAAGSAGSKSDATSLAQQTQYLDTTTRAYNTATDNFNVLQNFMSQYGINQSNVPIINQLQNNVKAGATDPGAIAAFQTQLSGLRSEYAQVLSRGGEVTDTARNTALSLIPDNLSPSQMATIKTQLDKEGGNAIQEAQAQVNTIKSRLSSGSSTSGGTNLGTNANASPTGNSVTAGGYTFVKNAQGQWVAQ